MYTKKSKHMRDIKEMEEDHDKKDSEGKVDPKRVRTAKSKLPDISNP